MTQAGIDYAHGARNFGQRRIVLWFSCNRVIGDRLAPGRDVKPGSSRKSRHRISTLSQSVELLIPKLIAAPHD